jgi:basic membrane protein A
VGLVTDVGTIADHSFNQFAWEGVQQAAEKLGAHVEYIESRDENDYAKNIAQFADDDCDVIVTVGFDLRDETLAAASTYPDMDFIGVDQFQEQSVDGVAGLIFAEDQAGFLAGALTAIMSRNQTIGAVCASDKVPYVWRFAEGYKAGAAYADQMKGVSTQVIVVYHGDVGKSFADPEWGESTVLTMLDQNTDVIFGCG